jgi:hypothetical protein
MAEKKVIALQVKLDTSEVNENVEKTTVTVEDLGDATKKTSSEMQQGFKAAEQGTKGLGSSIGGLIKALGVVGVAMAVFTFMKDILSKNQKIMDALSTATTALEIIFVKLFEAVEPIGDAMKAAFEEPKKAVLSLWEAIKENLVNRLKGVVLQFEALGDVIQSALDLDWEGVTDGAKDFASATVQVATGLDKVQQAAALEGLSNFVDTIQSGTVAAVDQAKALVALRNEVTLLEAEQRRLMLVYQNEAELQRQIRDDISLTIAERLRANEKLGEVLDEQSKKEEEIANKRLQLARAELALNKGSIELQASLIDAETELADVRERINGQRSEQLTNQKALEKELFDLQQEIRVATLEARELEFEELDIYYETLAEKARLAGESDVEIEEAKLNALADLKEKFINEDLAKEKAATKARIDIQNKEKSARLQAATSMIQGLGSLVQALGNQSKASVAIQKTLAIAQIAVDTARSISAGIAGATTSATATGPGAFVATPVFIATTIATILGAVGSAVSILNSAPGGGTATVPSVSIPQTSAAAPSFNPVTTNTTELGNTEAAELAPVQAFVVETQITGSQENVNQIEGQATFGEP